jgi:hypothetical protein
MKKNFNFQLTTIKGEPLKDETGALVTGKDIASTAWLTPDPRKYDGNKKSAFCKFAFALESNAEMDLKPEDIADLKALIGDGWQPLVVGQMYQFLDA